MMIRKFFSLPVRVCRKALRKLEPAAIRWGSRNRTVAALYYLLFNRGFSYEQSAFLAARIAYLSSLNTPEGNTALLRRNIHRIEKGLIMRPRRVPFGLDYIHGTVDAFRLACTSKDGDAGELRWANDVLNAYFTVNAGCEQLSSAREAFLSSVFVAETGGALSIPYRRDIENRPPVEYDALLKLAIRRRSVRWFLPTRVPRELLDRAVELGCLAPSACNRQPFEFRIFDDAGLIQNIVKIPFGLLGYGHNVPCLVVLVGQQRNYFDERDRHLIYIDGALATMGFLFALESQGLSSCCVNWPEIAANDEKMSSLLNLAADERPVMLIAVGYPDPEGMVPRSTKKSLSRSRRYNFE